MAKVPGIVPDPQPEQPPENPDHYLPDAEWGQVLRDAARFRRDADESETE